MMSDQDLMDLLKYSGFPEPFLGGSDTEARRWSREYRTRLIHEDIRTLEMVVNVGALELLSLRLPELVGAPKIRAVKKAQKHYHYDCSLVPDMSKRFENLVALHLLKWVRYKQVVEGLDWELRYFR